MGLPVFVGAAIVAVTERLQDALGESGLGARHVCRVRVGPVTVQMGRGSRGHRGGEGRGGEGGAGFQRGRHW